MSAQNYFIKCCTCFHYLVNNNNVFEKQKNTAGFDNEKTKKKKIYNELKTEQNREMSQTIFKACIFAKHKINLTWPYFS